MGSHTAVVVLGRQDRELREGGYKLGCLNAIEFNSPPLNNSNERLSIELETFIDKTNTLTL